MSEVVVCLPSGEASDQGDIVRPTTDLLRELNLLPTAKDLQASGGLAEAITGPATSIALLEAGATAASKWWAAGLGASVVAAWGSVAAWWTSESGDVRTTALWAVAVFSAAAVLGIAYLLGSDVRGRAAVQTETIRARATLAEAFVRAAQELHRTPVVPATAAVSAPAPAAAPVPVPPPSGPQLVELGRAQVRNLSRHALDQDGWQALAVLADGTAPPRYLLVKGNTHEWVAAADVEFGPPRLIDLQVAEQRTGEETAGNGHRPSVGV